MKIAFSLLLTLLLTGVVLAGNDASVLERLNGELKSLIGEVDRAVVEVRVPTTLPLTFYDKSSDQSRYAAVALAYLGRVQGRSTRKSVAGVLVGPRARLVTSASAVGGAQEVEITLFDGVTGKATL